MLTESYPTGSARAAQGKRTILCCEGATEENHPEKERGKT